MSGTNIYFKGKWKSQVFTASGTFTVPEEVDLVFVDMWGGGGAGGGTTSNEVAWGGEAGQNTVSPVEVTPAASITVTIGSGGTGTIGVAGPDGTDTSFGSLFARGGRGGGISDSSTPVDYAFDPNKGQGKGRDSSHASGGSNNFTFGGSNHTIAGGGDAGFGAGGNGVFTATGGDGGVGGGGGGALHATPTGGDGGDGRCVVYWKQD